MYAQLGTIIFSELKAFSSYKQDYQSKYAEHALVKGKARLESLGEQLETLNFGIRLHQDFINPETAFNELNLARTENTILPLVLGNGEYINDFIITNISKNIVHTATDGSTIFMDLTVTLKEYYNPDSTSVERQELIKNSMNQTPANIVEDIDGFATRSETTQAIDQIYEAENQAKIIDNVITEYEAVSALKEKAERKIAPALNKMAAAYDLLDGLLAKSENLYQKAVNLPYSISLALNSINSMKAALPINSPAEIRSNNTNLLNSVTIVRSSASNIFTSNAIRRP